MSKKKNKNVRVIPTKNYIKFAIICIITILAVFYANSWYRTYNTNKLNIPYINDKVNKINYEELNNYIIENPNLIIYVGKNNSELCYNFEKRLYNVLKKYDLEEEIIFLDLSNNYSMSILNNIQNKYYIDEVNTNLNNVPALLMIKDKKIKDILISENEEEITSDKIVQFLEEFEYIK